MRYLFLFFCVAVSAFADKLKLNNGTTVEGNILAETDAEYTVERSLAGGTIKTKDTIRKSDVAEVTRATPEEKTAAAMKEAYEAMKRYQLNSNNSCAKDYYDQVLTGVFQKFLADYPNSPFAAELKERIADWEFERDKVASGKVKVGGRWLDAAEAGLLAEKERAQQVTAQAQALAGQGRFQEAIQLLQPLRTVTQSVIAEEASRQEQQFYGKWRNYLDTRLKSIEIEIQTWEKRLQQTTAAAERARQSLITWKKTGDEGSIGYRALLHQHEDAVQRAESEERNCDVHLSQLREESHSVQQKLNELQSHMGINTIPILPHPSSPVEEDLLTKLTALAKQYWLYGLAGLVVLWLILRKR